MRKWILPLGALLALAWGSVARAETYVFMTNSTDKTVTVNTTQTGDKQLVKGTHWNQEATEIPAYATRRVVWMNRNEGITSGKNFYFNSTVTAPDGSQVVLQQRLKGTWTGSSIWGSGKAADFNMAWYSDRTIHRAATQYQSAASTAGLKFEFTGGFDDIYYVIQPNHVAEQVSQNANDFKVVAYNIWGVLTATKIADRFSLVPAYVAGNDVVIFSEAFDNSARETLINRMSATFPYHSSVVDSPLSIEDGGVILFSRWPIVKSQQIVYDRCNGSDCLAAKGAMYIEVIKNGRSYHVVGTHTQAWNADSDREVRLYQLGRARALADNQLIPAAEPVIYGGDLNVDKLLYADTDYVQMQNTLDVAAPSYSGYGYTYDPTVNAWGSDGREYLDYVLVSKSHAQPLSNINKVRIYRGTDDVIWRKWDLSDHFAVQAQLQF